MSAEWKPGDVAMRIGQFGSMVALFVEGCKSEHSGPADWSVTPHWHYENGGWSPDNTETPHRPLVVIDPEDREQVEALVAVLRNVKGEAELTNEPWSIPGLRVQAALREFANPKPPKPEEPLLQGDRVEDSERVHWVRFRTGDGPCGEDVSWINASGERREYADIAAVRVLSDGVTS